jgi:hypothetical protein
MGGGPQAVMANRTLDGAPNNKAHTRRTTIISQLYTSRRWVGEASGWIACAGTEKGNNLVRTRHGCDLPIRVEFEQETMSGSTLLTKVHDRCQKPPLPHIPPAPGAPANAPRAPNERV